MSFFTQNVPNGNKKTQLKKSSQIKNQIIRNTLLNNQNQAAQNSSLILSQERMFGPQAQINSSANKRKKGGVGVSTSSEFRNTSNGPLSRKAAH
jgi:hypothetical protein